MKSNIIRLAAMLALSVCAGAQAATQIVPLKVEGQIFGNGGNQKVRTSSFVATNEILVAAIDPVAGTITLQEVTGDLTNLTVVATLMESDTSAFIPNKTVAATLKPAGGAATVTLQNGLVFGGELLVSGMFGVNKFTNGFFKASVAGIWNDPIVGNTNAAPAFFRGELMSQPASREHCEIRSTNLTVRTEFKPSGDHRD